MAVHYSRTNQPSNTMCPRCKVEMSVGKAIKYGDSKREQNVCTGFGRVYITNDTLTLIECLKCPECGYSDDLN